MNVRQQLYKANRIKGMNQYNAARVAGYSDTYARQACRVEKLVKVSMADVFEQKGLTDSAIADHALKGLEADSYTKAGKIPNWKARHSYLETICKMTDRLKDKHEHSGLSNTQVNVYPNKTIIFRDIDDSDQANIRNVYEPEGSAGIRAEGTL